MDIKPTEGQEVAVDKMKRFLKSSDRIFRLTGAGGTGKTTIIRWGLEELLKSDIKQLNGLKKKSDYSHTPNVFGITLAHKAKVPLQKSIPFCSTFASAFGMKEGYDKATGERIFIVDKEKISKAMCKRPVKVFVVDEFSMFSKSMIDMLLKETTMYSKIIIMGDQAQCPPILPSGVLDNDKDSPFFYMDLPDSCSHELLEQIRQTDGNPITELAIKIRELIFDDPTPQKTRKIIDFMKETNLVDGKGYGSCLYPELYDLYRDCSKNYLDTKVIAYRNNVVGELNTNLRNYIHNYPTDIFIENELVFMQATYFGYDQNSNPFQFYNSSEYIIRQLSDGAIDGVNVMWAFLEDGRAMAVKTGVVGDYNHLVWLQHKESYSKVKDWKGMHGFCDQFGSFSYGYALTVYKAQGSTYKTVFIDANDIFGRKVLSIKRRLQAVYTALTRASDNVYFIKQ